MTSSILDRSSAAMVRYSHHPYSRQNSYHDADNMDLWGWYISVFYFVIL